MHVYRRNHPMGSVGRGEPGDQVYLVPFNFCKWLSFLRWAVREAYNASQGPNLQNILRFIVRLSYVYRKIDLR